MDFRGLSKSGRTIPAMTAGMETTVTMKKRVGSAPGGARAIGERLTRFRKAKGLTQVELAEKLESTQALVSKYERGDLMLHGELIVRFAAILGVTTDELLGAEKKSAAKEPPPVIKDRRLVRRIQLAEQLPRRDKDALMRTIDMYLRSRGA